MRRPALCMFVVVLVSLAGSQVRAQHRAPHRDMVVVSDRAVEPGEAVAATAAEPQPVAMSEATCTDCAPPQASCGESCSVLSQGCDPCAYGPASGCGYGCKDPCCANGGFFVNAWLDQGFMGNTDSPSDNFNGPLLFTDRSNEYLMNQLYLSLGRAVNKKRRAWDIGGQVDLLYGTDYYFTQATGLETNRDGTPKWNSPEGPRGTGASIYGLAMPQLYAEVFAPVGNGLTVKMGHFYTIIGYESVMAPENFFYSHSYSMMYAEPFTHTGMLASYGTSPGLQLHGGFTRGWDTWEDPNNTLAFLGGASWTSQDERTSVAFALHTGNEDTSGNNRTMYSLVFSQELTPRLTYVFQHDLGVQANGAVVGGNRVNANWYSINQYLFYKITQTLSFGTRVEWFRDEHSTRVLTLPADQVEGSDFSQLTLGLNWKPRKCLVVRPEVRWDWSGVNAPGQGVDGMYNSFSKKSQFLLGLDVILRR